MLTIATCVMRMKMKKLWLLAVLTGFLLSPSAFAGDDGAYVSLFDNTSQADKIDKTSAQEPDDEHGIFSFLNFKPKKKVEPKLTVADEKRLSPLEQSIKLADKGDLNAQLLLGYSYLYGENGAEVDYDKAFEYYARAAMQNDNVGLNNLGSLYYSGIGIERNTAKAAILFEKAASLGNAEAAVNLGFILITGNGVKKNPVQAMTLFEQGAALNNPTAKFMLGYAYYTGKLRPRDMAQAAKLMKEAAAAKFDEAQYILALMYVNGQGLPQNYGNAVKNLKAAVSQGHVLSMTTLGDILASGKKYAKDNFTAHVMFNLAAVRGAPEAAEKRDFLEEKLKIDELLSAQAQAESYHEKASELTAYIRQTFGTDIRSYIDTANLSDKS